MNDELAFPGTDDGRTVAEFDAQIKAHNAQVAAPAAPVARCAQCEKEYRHGSGVGCPKCAPGVSVPEADFRKPIAAPVAQPDDEFEVRADGKRVRVDRWEVAIRRIVALLWGNRHEFEVDDVVEAVRALVPTPNEDDESLVQAVLAGNYSGAPRGSAPAAPVAQGEPLPGWKFNHARRHPDPDQDGAWEIGFLDDEDDRFSPIITVDTGLYFQNDQAEPLARAILAKLAAPAALVAHCRADGRCQYAIDHGAEGIGACPLGKCCMPAASVAQPVSEPSDADINALAWHLEAVREHEQYTGQESLAVTGHREFARAVLALRPKVQPLTDDALWLLWNKHGSDDMSQQEAIAFARSVIAEFCRVNGISQGGAA